MVAELLEPGGRWAIPRYFQINSLCFNHGEEGAVMPTKGKLLKPPPLPTALWRNIWPI